MDHQALELYLYMGSTEPVIKWLKEEGCQTRQQVIDKLAPLVKSNMYVVASHIGKGDYGASLAGTSNGVTKILKLFPETVEVKKDEVDAKKKFKADIEINKFTRQGWDTYNDTSTITIEADSADELKQEIGKYISGKTSTHKGDFGITLGDTSCRVLRTYMANETEIKL
jgi:hypothetical protein